ncbi:MAG: beta-ketoacyl-ACP synthase 3 [Oscillospiraceae bacterium]|nr:beta-ketoacyl-ACP synthase 3 [Oscillospiraceae bacterium]
MDEFGGIKIIGTGSFLPDYSVSNSDFTKYIETDNEWITTRTGISERRFHFSGDNAQMSAAAAKNALEDSGCCVDDIDFIIASTATPDYFYPSLSCLTANALGCENVGCLDVNAACTGFINALDVARAYLATGTYKRILVTASEKLSSQVDFNERSTAVLFGDGAGAVVVEKSDGLYSSYIGSTPEGEKEQALYCRVKYEPNYKFVGDVAKGTAPRLIMDGKTVYKFAVEALQNAATKAANKLSMSVSEFDVVIPHQANIRIIKSAIKALGIPPEKVYSHISKRANTSSACIPTCLDELKKAGKLERGMKICAVAFGAGLTFGSICFTY